MLKTILSSFQVMVTLKLGYLQDDRAGKDLRVLPLHNSFNSARDRESLPKVTWLVKK